MSPAAKQLVKAEIVVAVVAVALLALSFGPALRGEFVWDDVYYVRDNATLQRGPLRDVFTQAMWGTAAPTPAQFYRPLPMLTLWLQARMTGLSLPAFRIGNLVLHGACGALLATWLRKQGVSRWIAACAALAFLVHPSVCESVQWVMGRHDLIATLLALAALVLWPGPGGSRRRALAASVASALAFLSKESFAIVPALLLMDHLLARWRAGAKWLDRDLTLLLLPVLGALAVVGIRSAAGVSTSSAGVRASLGALLSAYATVVAHYTSQLVTWSNGPTAESWKLVGAGATVATLLALVAAGVALAFAARRGSQPAAGALLGLAMYAVALAPLVLALPFTEMFGNRYAYFPLVAAIVALAHGASALAPRLQKAAPRLVGVVSLAFGVAILLSALSTAAEATLWRDPVTLFGADVARSPRDSKALYHYAHALGVQGGCVAAAPVYQRAVEADPTYTRAWHNLTGCLINLGEHRAAVFAGQRTLFLSGGAPRDEYNLGVALVSAGQRDEGIEHLARAVELEPGFVPARAALASARREP